MNLTFTFIFVLFGLACGSFATMLSYRLPLKLSLCKPGSACPTCQHKLSWRELIPVWSWLISFGKCVYCKKSISIRYPLIEVIMAGCFIWIKLNYGINFESTLLCLMMLLLVTLIVTDLEHYIIPNQILLILLPIALMYKWRINLEKMQFDLLGILCSGLLYFGLGLTLRYFFQIVRKKEALGFGDIKFLFIIVLFLSPEQLPVFMFMAGAFGVVLGMVWQFIGYGKVFPFGPALAFSLIICIFFPIINQYYLSLGHL